VPTAGHDYPVLSPEPSRRRGMAAPPKWLKLRRNRRCQNEGARRVRGGVVGGCTYSARRGQGERREIHSNLSGIRSVFLSAAGEPRRKNRNLPALQILTE